MRRKWAERLLAHLIPHAGEIAHLAPLRGDNEEQEFHDLLGDTRFRTLRQRCLVLEHMLKWDLPIPWKESNVRELLIRGPGGHSPQAPALLGHTPLVRQEIRASGRAGRTPPSPEEADRGDRAHPAMVQPARKAKVPPKGVIWALAEGACWGAPSSRSS